MTKATKKKFDRNAFILEYSLEALHEICLLQSYIELFIRSSDDPTCAIVGRLTSATKKIIGNCQRAIEWHIEEVNADGGGGKHDAGGNATV